MLGIQHSMEKEAFPHLKKQTSNIHGCQVQVVFISVVHLCFLDMQLKKQQIYSQ